MRFVFVETTYRFYRYGKVGVQDPPGVGIHTSIM